MWEVKHVRREVPPEDLHQALASATGPHAKASAEAGPDGEAAAQEEAATTIRLPGFLHLWKNDLARILQADAR